jgi:hypothetical protein
MLISPNPHCSNPLFKSSLMAQGHYVSQLTRAWSREQCPRATERLSRESFPSFFEKSPRPVHAVNPQRLPFTKIQAQDVGRARTIPSFWGVEWLLAKDESSRTSES